MPKVKDCKITVKGSEFVSPMKVDSRGVFTIKLPGTEEDWPDRVTEVRGTEAEKVEKEWQKAIRELCERTRKERKVIVVKFDSKIRAGGKKDFFVDDDAMIYLRAAVALETTICQGEKVKVSYQDHPDCNGMHKENPFPWWMRLQPHQFERGENCVIEWTQELQDTVARAGAGIQAIVNLLDDVFSTPEKLALASSRIAALPSLALLNESETLPGK